MAFEFDSEKSVANKARHGIDFGEAQEIWTDTYRNENIRIISVRRARAEEEARYLAE